MYEMNSRILSSNKTLQQPATRDWPKTISVKRLATEILIQHKQTGNNSLTKVKNNEILRKRLETLNMEREISNGNKTLRGFDNETQFS